MRLSTALIAVTGLLATFVSSAPLAKRAPAAVHYNCTVPGTFALTFDDGPNVYTWDLIKELNRRQIKATFFINGHNGMDVTSGSTVTSDGVKTYMEHLKFMHESGHQIASHTDHHVSLDNSTPDVIIQEMKVVSDIVYSAIGARPKYMRPPYGEGVTSQTLEVLGQLRYEVVIWNLDPKDFDQTISMQAKHQEINAVLASEHSTTPTSSHIILLHDIHNSTTTNLAPYIIDQVSAKGYNFTTVAQCLNDPHPYY
ncbi:unnamed protein product [Cunninghamella blakesleeana]